jgi:hypothetical protein
MAKGEKTPAAEKRMGCNPVTSVKASPNTCNLTCSD